jgi:hypothetical protein
MEFFCHPCAGQRMPWQAAPQAGDSQKQSVYLAEAEL